MKVLYHIPSLDSIYAHRTIYNGFRNAFQDLGHEFRPLTADHDLAATLVAFRPDLFITTTHYYYRKALDFALLKRFRGEGMFMLTKVDFWVSPISSARFNEARSMRDDKVLRGLLNAGLMGDAFFHVVEQDDPRMEGFSAATGHVYHTIPLAADRTLLRPLSDSRFAADIAYVGSALPEKREFFRRYVFPLRDEFDLRIYGQDWTAFDSALGWVQRVGQYFNVKTLARIRKPKLALEDEARIYASSKVSINVHEDFQRRFGGDCNERTFKIPLCGGFQVVDSVACIRKYFDCTRELAIADTPREWVDAVRHYASHPQDREPIIRAGRERVLREHTYHNRARAMMEIMNRSGK
jgi:spore maturation protein CgeB